MMGYKLPGTPAAAGKTLNMGEVYEVSLLLAGTDFETLEARAHACGLTCGQLIRRVLRAYLAHVPGRADAGEQ